MPAVGVVSGARAFGGNHRGAQRRLRRAGLSERGAVVRFLQAAKHLPADALAGFLRLDILHFEQPLGIVVAIFVAQLVSALGNDADAAPLAVADFEDLFDQLPRLQVSFPAHGPAVLVFHDRRARLELAHRHQHAFEHVHRLKTRDHDRHAIAAGDRLVFLVPHHRANMPRPKKALHAITGRFKNGGHRRWNQHMRYQHAEIVQLSLLRQPDRHRIGRRGGFKSDRKENHLLIRIRRREVHRIHWRINDAHVRPALRFQLQQIAARSRHAQHVAERTERHLRPRDDGVRPVDHLHRRDADRAAGAVHQFDRFGENFINAIFDDGVRLPAADFHDDPGPGRGAGNRGGQFFRRFGVAIFVEIFHGKSSGHRRRFQFIQLIHPFVQEIKDPRRLGFVEARQGETDMNENVLADLYIGNMFETDLLDHAAEIDFAHEHIVLTERLDDFSRNSKAHPSSPLGEVSTAKFH